LTAKVDFVTHRKYKYPMPWTYEQRIQRVCQSLVDKNLLDKSQISNLKRPLFFGQYAFSLGFSPVANQWVAFDDLKEKIIKGLNTLDYHFHPNRSTLDYHVFSSNVTVLRWLERNQGAFQFNHLRLVNQECWGLSLPRPKRKTKFFNLYGWRVRFKDPNWGKNEDNLSLLEGLSGPYRFQESDTFFQQPSSRSLLYLSHKNDVLMFKIMASESILSIEDRSTL
jgi:hypothetical protein